MMMVMCSGIDHTFFVLLFVTKIYLAFQLCKHLSENIAFFFCFINNIQIAGSTSPSSVSHPLK